MSGELTTTPTDPDAGYAELAAAPDTISIAGRPKVEKNALEDIPHVITAIRYQNDGYVTVEATVAPEHAIEGETQVLYNDGGTGIRRQLTKILHTLTRIEVARVNDDDTDFDAEFLAWKTYPGIDSGDLPSFNQLIHIRRGLRVSHYTHPKFGEASTWYLA